MRKLIFLFFIAAAVLFSGCQFASGPGPKAFLDVTNNTGDSIVLCVGTYESTDNYTVMDQIVLAGLENVYNFEVMAEQDVYIWYETLINPEIKQFTILADESGLIRTFNFNGSSHHTLELDETTYSFDGESSPVPDYGLHPLEDYMKNLTVTDNSDAGSPITVDRSGFWTRSLDSQFLYGTIEVTNSGPETLSFVNADYIFYDNEGNPLSELNLTYIYACMLDGMGSQCHLAPGESGYFIFIDDLVSSEVIDNIAEIQIQFDYSETTAGAPADYLEITDFPARSGNAVSGTVSNPSAAALEWYNSSCLFGEDSEGNLIWWYWIFDLDEIPGSNADPNILYSGDTRTFTAEIEDSSNDFILDPTLCYTQSYDIRISWEVFEPELSYKGISENSIDREVLSAPSSAIREKSMLENRNNMINRMR